MSSLEEDLRHTQTFLWNQKKILEPGQFAKTVDAQVEQWCQRFKSNKLVPSMSAALSNMLSQGPWSETQKNLLGTALADAVSAVPSTKKARRPMQELKAFRSYLTGDDLRVMGSDVGAMVKVGLAVERCAALGLHLPNTGTLKHIIASLCDCHLAFL